MIILFFTNSVSDHKDCPHCGKSIYGPNAGIKFKNHLKKHIPKKTMVCNYCNKDYKRKSELERHLNTCKARKKTYKIINDGKQKVISNEKANKLVHKVAKKSSDTEKEMDGKILCETIVKSENLNLETESSYHKFEIDKEKSLVVISKI